MHPKTKEPIPPAVTESQWWLGMRTTVVFASAGEQPSVPVKLCRASAAILERPRAAKRRVNQVETSGCEAVQAGATSGGEVPQAVVARAAGEQPSVPMRLCHASSCILDRLRASKRQADRGAASGDEVAQQCRSSSSFSPGEAVSKRRRITGKATPSIVGGATIEWRGRGEIQRNERVELEEAGPPLPFSRVESP